MKNRKPENSVLALAVLVVLGSFAFAIHGRPTADQVTVVKATGINCGVIIDIEKSLFAKQGVVAVDVNPDEGKVIVGYDSKIIQPNEIASVITEMGYEIFAMKTSDIDSLKAVAGKGPDANTASVGCGGFCAVRR
jgi:copper chaperone CopZ